MSHQDLSKLTHFNGNFDDDRLFSFIQTQRNLSLTLLNQSKAGWEKEKSNRNQIVFINRI